MLSISLATAPLTAMLVDSAKRLAQARIDLSTSTPGANAKKLSDANGEMTAAQSDIGNGNWAGAIGHYGNAWDKALAAVK